jgi:hypothetical protein
LYGYEFGGGGVGERGGKNVVEVFKGLADSVNREFFTAKGVWGVAGLEDDVVREVESVEFGQNVIIVRKREQSDLGGEDGGEEFYERYYRMAENVEGYEGGA